MGHKGCKSEFDTRPLGNNNCADSVFSQEKPIRGQNVSITAKEIRDTNAEYLWMRGSSVAMGQMLNEEGYRYC